ncbi:cation:proton antiporter domain-containing protein [Puniceicoccus vermicola]|uniref:Sodium:proton antiporter n=1 Tax=Puniceicoccus vermicola TaxID=388746 RepID=A0A7X1AW08_9BACT|nr:sodium:proton antiporter [Puniceicoccus vermicola]
MDKEILIGLTWVIFLGTFAQWCGWRFQIPSILLLLTFGLVAGPGIGLLDPDALFGDLVFPVASIAVAVILFEGGLSLNLKEFRESGTIILRLISIGGLLTWLLSTFFAWLLLGLSLEISLLLGALLVITGPTVIGPMLRQIRPRGRVSHVVKWEGILNDPVGAILSVLILETVLHGGLDSATSTFVSGILVTLGVGIVGAIVGAFVLIFAMRHRWLPDYLHIPVTLTVVIALNSVSNLFQEEAGLVSVTLLGIILANQRTFPIKHIIEFKENLQILLISGLFIVLGARVEPDTLFQVGWSSLLFLLASILIVRPLSVVASTVGTKLIWKERFFLMLMAPRGIVVTALASVFAFRLSQTGDPDGERLFAEVLFVILGTVLFYGIAASVYARKVQIGSSNPQGLILVGAHPWARMIAVALKRNGIHVALIDSNGSHTESAINIGLEAHQGNIHSSEFMEEIDFSEIGRGLAVTGNAEINAFAELALGKHLGKTHVYHLATGENSEKARGGSAERQQNVLFDSKATFDLIEKEFYSGAVVREIHLKEDWDPEKAASFDGFILPLFVIGENGQLRIFSSRSTFVPKAGGKILALHRSNDKTRKFEPTQVTE